jgi:CHAT domain-containing protein
MGVLAGCETAGGRPTNGEGVLGLTSAFLSAGVPVVVSSRWPVDDRATAVLMQHFYDRLAAGESVSSALRDAQLAVRANRRTSHPFYWAGFAVIGDGTRVLPPVMARTRRGLWVTVAGTALLVGLAGWTWRKRQVPSRAAA